MAKGDDGDAADKGLGPSREPDAGAEGPFHSDPPELLVIEGGENNEVDGIAGAGSTLDSSGSGSETQSEQDDVPTVADSVAQNGRPADDAALPAKDNLTTTANQLAERHDYQAAAILASREHLNRLFRTAVWKLGGDKAAAEELCQETFLEFHNALKRGKVENVAALLNRIMSCKIAGEYKRRRENTAAIHAEIIKAKKKERGDAQRFRSRYFVPSKENVRASSGYSFGHTPQDRRVAALRRSEFQGDRREAW